MNASVAWAALWLGTVIVVFLAQIIGWAFKRLEMRREREIQDARPRCKHGNQKYGLPRCADCRKEDEEFFGEHPTTQGGDVVARVPWAEQRLATCNKCGYSQPAIEQWFHECLPFEGARFSYNEYGELVWHENAAMRPATEIVCGHCGRNSHGNPLENVADPANKAIWRCFNGCRKSEFKAGQWVRWISDKVGVDIGTLGRVIEDHGGDHYAVQCGEFKYQGGVHLLEPALPKMGEWWRWDRSGCPHGLTITDTSPFVWEMPPEESDNDVYRRHVAHGCLIPVNFGKGN